MRRGAVLGRRDNFCLMFARGRCCLCLSGEVAYRWQAAHFQHLSTRQHLSMSSYLNTCSPQYPISRVTANHSLDTYLLHDAMALFEPWPLEINRWHMRIRHNNKISDFRRNFIQVISRNIPRTSLRERLGHLHVIACTWTCN